MNTVFEKYKDLHKGKRVFLIANGPSLAETNLDLLEEEICIAMNRIPLIYEKNPKWRPTYYLFSSTNVNNPIWGKPWTESVISAIKEKQTTPFISSQFKKNIDPDGKYSNINWLDCVSETKPDPDGSISKSCFSKDVVERIDKSGTTMNLALQLSYHMGFSEIILLGADLGFTKDLGSNLDPNHFDKSYRASVGNPDKANYQMRNIHSLAYKNFIKKDKNIKFYNASIKTTLDVYPIIDYEKYILENKVITLKQKQKQAESNWNKPHQFFHQL